MEGCVITKSEQEDAWEKERKERKGKWRDSEEKKEGRAQRKRKRQWISIAGYFDFVLKIYTTTDNKQIKQAQCEKLLTQVQVIRNNSKMSI